MIARIRARKGLKDKSWEAEMCLPYSEEGKAGVAGEGTGGGVQGEAGEPAIGSSQFFSHKAT